MNQRLRITRHTNIKMIALITMLVVIVLSGCGRGPSGSASNVASVSLPVTRCDSQYVSSRPNQKSIPQSMTAGIPDGMIGRVSLYTDERGWLRPLLAPSGWDCKAAFYGDGSFYFTVYPRNAKSLAVEDKLFPIGLEYPSVSEGFTDCRFCAYYYICDVDAVLAASNGVSQADCPGILPVVYKAQAITIGHGPTKGQIIWKYTQLITTTSPKSGSGNPSYDFDSELSWIPNPSATTQIECAIPPDLIPNACSTVLTNANNILRNSGPYS